MGRIEHSSAISRERIRELFPDAFRNELALEKVILDLFGPMRKNDERKNLLLQKCSRELKDIQELNGQSIDLSISSLRKRLQEQMEKISSKLTSQNVNNMLTPEWHNIIYGEAA